MPAFLRSGLVLAIAVSLAVGIATLPSRATDGSKALKKRIRTIERDLVRTHAELAESTAAVETLQIELADTRVLLGDTAAVALGAQDKLQYMTLSLEPINGLVGPHIIFEGCNVHVRSGSGDSVDGTYDLDLHSINSAETPLGLGNLIVGYNEQPGPDGAERGGSHNLIVGPRHAYPKVCGAVFGQENLLTGPLAMVAGFNNEAQGYTSSVSGGDSNTASALASSVTGGVGNTASGHYSSVSGGQQNSASGSYSSVSGGRQRSAGTNDDWAAGSLLEHE